MKITLGGNRLGSGKKMDTYMENYGRSTHNLSQSWKSTMAPGVLVPFMKILALNGDTFDIDLEAGLRTIPTKAPIYGSFKLQLDVFQCPIRLYQGILHNNPVDLGMQMQNVFLPTMELGAYNLKVNGGYKNSQVATNSLVRYLGMSGAGRVNDDAFVNAGEYETREIQCVPLLAYYDIFKNYYSNKQEDDAYVITPNEYFISETLKNILNMNIVYLTEDGQFAIYDNDENSNMTLTVEASNPKLTELNITFKGTKINYLKDTQIQTGQYNGTSTTWQSPETLEDFLANKENAISYTYVKDRVNNTTNVRIQLGENFNNIQNAIQINAAIYNTELPIRIEAFPLKNIDKMREQILKQSEIGTACKLYNLQDELVKIGIPYPGGGVSELGLPYEINEWIVEDTTSHIGLNAAAYPMVGLCLKTYQSDLFNNWLQKEWIDGDNGVSAVTAVDVSEGTLNLDALNLAQKIYNMLNRIAASGGTYQDWQRAVYGTNVINHSETPIWCGGMSSEIIFDEVVSTAATEGEELTNTLGGLAGKGKLVGKKGGKLHIKINEPSYIIGIVSITPRVDYTSGNDFDLTDVWSTDDFHKPELDGIGFQDLIGEQMAWWDTKVWRENSGASLEILRNGIGKVPAWINYMTAVNKAYGDFAAEEGMNYMILDRNYGRNNDGTVADFTTYIDPSKFNYAFAYSDLAAQNFWVQIVSDIKARRKMSAKIIPNL